MTRPVATWQVQLDAGEDREQAALPMFLRIARTLANDARSGRLAPGTRLPSSRALADSLRVHRNTALAAYRELASEGFLQTEHGRGTFIASTLPEIEPKRWQAARSKPSTGTARRARPARPAFDFEPTQTPSPFVTLPPRTLALYGGMPDTRLLPRPALARAYRRALNARVELLAYGEPQGELRLREALAHMLRATRGLHVTAADLLVTRGSQMALSLLGPMPIS